jgi:hypothetical protein
MSDTPQLDELTILANRLKSLVDDPQTGLFSWHKCLAEVLAEIAEFAPKKEVA